MTTKKPKAPASPVKGNKTAKKTTSPKKPSKPSLSQQKRLKALRGSVVAPPAPVPRTEAPAGFRELRDANEKALEKALAARIPYPEPLGAIFDFKPYPSDPHMKVAPPFPAPQKRDKKLLYAALGIGAFVLAAVVCIGSGL